MSYQIYNEDQIGIRIRRDLIKPVIKRFRNYPLYSLPSEFINNLSNQFPVMMLTQTGGIQVVGWYNLSVRMLGLPTSLVSASIAEVFRQRASEDYFTKGSCRPVFLKVFKTLSLASIGPLLILLLFSPALFAFFFGRRWEEAGVITQVLAILYAFKFVASPLSYVTYIANKQWAGLLVDISLLTIVFAIYYTATTYHLHYLTSLIIFASCYSALYFLTFYLSYKFTINEKFAAEIQTNS